MRGALSCGPCLDWVTVFFVLLAVSVGNFEGKHIHGLRLLLFGYDNF